MLIQKRLGCYSHPFSELAPHFPTERAPSPRACSSFSSSNPFHHLRLLFFQIFLILSNSISSLPVCAFLSSLLILHILAILHHPGLYSRHQPPSKCLPFSNSSMSVKNLKLLIPHPHNPIPYTPQPALPWVTVVAPCSESEAKLTGNPQRGFV